ncbi:MAG: cyanophycin synthetase [Polyangiaceae bacterium]
MKLTQVRALRGPNLWSNDTAIQADVNVGARQALVLAELARELQVEVGCNVKLAKATAPNRNGDARVVVGYTEEAVGRRALELAAELLSSEPSTVQRQTAVKELSALLHAEQLGPSTASIAEAARARGVYVRRVTDGSLVQLGQGARQRRIWAAETDKTSAIGESIAQNKDLTKSLLARVGVPVPKGQVVTTADEAWAAARTIGGPVVVKPLKGNQGKRVIVGISTEAEVREAFAVANYRKSEVLVEQQIFGDDYRLLVIGGKLVAAARRDVPKVIGDGTSNIRELVAVANEDPRRGEDHATSLSKLLLDDIAEEVLASQSLTFDSVVEAGRVVILRRNANLSTGGTAKDVTDEVHPDVAARAIDAARMVGLDIAGVDVVATRVDQPLEVTRGAVVEVNAAPGLRMHLDPSEGQGRAVGEAIVDSMFQPGEDARIPVLAVTGTNGKTTTVRCIAHILKGRGHTVGWTCTDGIYVDGRRVDTGDCSGPKSARLVLSHPLVDAAVLETARGGILREGLGFDLCDVAVVTNIADGDHLGMSGIETISQLAEVKATIVRAVSPKGAAVLNANDPLCVKMAAQCPGNVIYFARRFDNPVLVAHRRAGGHYVTVKDGYVVFGRGEEVERVIAVDAVPLTHGGRIGFEVDNVLAAAAACWSIGVPKEIIQGRLGNFEGDIGTVPGRFNVITYGRSTIILDYGHNASALFALVEAISELPHQSRSIVYTAAGDRRDLDIFEQAAIIGNEFDRVYLYEDKCTRGRADGEVIRLMRQGLAATRRVQKLYETRGEFNAIQMALDNLRPGELLLCQVDQVEDALEYVNRQLAHRPRCMPSVSEQSLSAAPFAS